MQDSNSEGVAAGKLIGGLIRGARKARGWTQARLATKAEVARETVYRVELGRMPTGDVLRRLCDAMGADRDRFNLRRRETDHIAMHPDLTLLRERRRALGLTLAECAAQAGVSSATMSRFERGAERSRRLASFDATGRPVALVSDGLARALRFKDVAALDHYWRTGRLR